MNPSDQQGYFQPDQNQPAQPVPQPTPVVDGSSQSATPVAAQAPIAADPAPAQAAPAPVAQPAPQSEELEEEPLTWAAFEYIHQEKGKLWFTIFAILTVLLLGLTLFLQQWSFAAVVAVIAVVIVVSSKRPPRELTYSLTEEGLYIDGKLHEFDKFKAFGVVRDGEEYSVMLIPTQRFQPGVTVYFPEEAGEEIVDILGSVLPMKDLKLDAVDRMVRILRL